MTNAGVPAGPQTPVTGLPALPDCYASSLTISAAAQLPACAGPGGSSQPSRGPSGSLPSDWQGHLPGPLRSGVVMVQGLFDRAWSDLRGLFSHGQPQVRLGPTTPADRAKAAFLALENNLGGPDGTFGNSVKARWLPTSVWPQGQAIAGALDLAAVTGDYRPASSAIAALSLYRQGPAYAPDIAYGPGQDRYYDDNEWLGLDLVQAYNQTGNQAYLDRAEGLFDFLQSGQTPSGGMHWVENSRTPSRNTCSNGPAIELALRLYQATHDGKYLDFATKTDAFLESTLRSPSGLYYDSIGDDGTLHPDIWSYNQGTPIGADVLFYQVTGDQTYLDRAKQTAAAALTHLGQDDRLWKQPPAFNAIFFRNLLQLDRIAPDPRYRQALDSYLGRVWTQARDPKTGLFDQGGVGHYGTPGNPLDQGAITQMFALQAMTPAQLSRVS